MAVMTRVPFCKGLKFLQDFKERSGAALRKDFDCGELRYSRSARRKVDLVGPGGGGSVRGDAGAWGESRSDVILRLVALESAV